VALTPLTTGGLGDGDPVFRTVTGSSWNSGTNITTLILDEAIPGSFAQGAITTAERIEPSFVLTSFQGVNFSKGGGLFVDVVEGRAADNLGIQLSDGLIPWASIGIRERLDADMVLGTTRKECHGTERGRRGAIVREDRRELALPAHRRRGRL